MGRNLVLALCCGLIIFSTPVASKSEAESASSVIELEQIVTPVVSGNKVLATYAVRLNLEVADPSKLEQAHTFLPRLQDSIIEELFIIMPLLWNGEGQPDTELITKRLEKALTKKAPEGLIGHVTIRESNLFDETDKLKFMEESPAVMMLPQSPSK